MDQTSEDKINKLMEQLFEKEQREPLKYGEQLARIGGPEVQQKLILVLREGDMEDAFLAAKVLATMDAKEESLDVLLEVIHLPANKNQNGGLVSLLEEFDLSEKFVDLFRIYLFGNFKASALAKNHLDYTEFDINSRTLKKAEKHWNHFLNNATNDDAFELRKEEAGTILQEIRELLQEG